MKTKRQIIFRVLIFTIVEGMALVFIGMFYYLQTTAPNWLASLICAIMMVVVFCVGIVGGWTIWTEDFN